jgi:hypothetical protein
MPNNPKSLKKWLQHKQREPRWKRPRLVMGYTRMVVIPQRKADASA